MTKTTGLSRREFLAGSAIAGTAAAFGLAGCAPQASAPGEGGAGPDAETPGGYSFETAPEPIDEASITEVVEADVVVVGAGWSGICAALSCSQQGLRVAVVEKRDTFGTRGGDINAIWSKAMEEQGIPREPVDQVLRRDLQRYDYNINQQLWMRWWNNSEESMNWLIDIAARHGLKPAIGAGNEDPAGINAMYPGAHSFVVEDFDIYGPDFCAFMEQYGMTLLNPCLVQEAEAAGCVFHYSTSAVQLVREGGEGRVCAVIAQGADGAYRKFAAEKAVVLATGDYSGDEEMMQKYCSWAKEIRDVNMAEPGWTGAGDGHKMGLWAGAAWQQGDPSGAMIVQWAFESLGTSKQAYTCHEGLMVNSQGKRFMNEVANQCYVAMAQMRQPNYEIWPIWNESWADLKADVPYKVAPLFKTQPELDASYPRALWAGGVESGAIVKADTLEDLIAMTSLPAEQTLATIAEYNASCAAGVDAQFAKDPQYLHPLTDGPFYTTAEPVGMPLFYSAMGGLRTDEYNNALDADDQPIEGLYVVGVMTGGLFSGFYNWAIPGHNMGQSLTLGYMLGKHLAGNE